MPGSKSTYNRQRGWRSERQALQYFLKKKFNLVAQRYRSPWAEIDLILLSPEQEVVIIEVKSGFAEDALNIKQALRLNRFVTWLESQVSLSVRCHLAVVSPHSQVSLFEDVLCELL